MYVIYFSFQTHPKRSNPAYPLVLIVGGLTVRVPEMQTWAPPVIRRRRRDISHAAAAVKF